MTSVHDNDPEGEREWPAIRPARSDDMHENEDPPPIQGPGQWITDRPHHDVQAGIRVGDKTPVWMTYGLFSLLAAILLTGLAVAIVGGDAWVTVQEYLQTTLFPLVSLTAVSFAATAVTAYVRWRKGL